MKKIILILVVIALFSCKKNDDVSIIEGKTQTIYVPSYANYYIRCDAGDSIRIINGNLDTVIVNNYNNYIQSHINIDTLQDIECKIYMSFQYNTTLVSLNNIVTFERYFTPSNEDYILLLNNSNFGY